MLTPDPDPEHAFFSVQTGEVRIRGFEAEGKASLMDGLDLVGAYTYSDSEITESNDPLELGNEVALIPKHQASLWADYTIGRGRSTGSASAPASATSASSTATITTSSARRPSPCSTPRRTTISARASPI